ncbi:hypothetical protein [Paraclostridium dentum]|uniref:hypothetical protein n=1 Tax=Paraclostridium dentum TaxID=2662455 RepID=UPI003F41849E
MKDLRELEGAISLIAKFDIEEDDNKIDSVICHAIEKGLDIEDLEIIETEEEMCYMYV